MTIRLPERPAQLARFDGIERAVHWTTATLVGTCLLTALALSFAPVSTLVGRRDVVRWVHVVAGLLIPVPLVAGLVVGRGQLRRDVGRLNRFARDDRQWLRTWGRDPLVRLGKFNPGQKLNAAFVAGALVLLYATGLVLKWFEPFPLRIRTGSTFVHDWVAFLLAIDVLGHIGKALADPEALRGMATGRVSARWAAKRAPRWAEELSD